MAADARLRRCRITHYSGGLEAAIQSLPGLETPNLLIIETALAGEDLLSRLEALAPSVPEQTQVVLLGRVNDIALYRQLLGLGIADYLLPESDRQALITAIAALFSGPDKPARLISVYGVRGGIGASTVAVNLAYTLGRVTEEDVILVDLDMAFGIAALSLNLSPRQSVVEALAQPDRLDDTLLARFLAKYDTHLQVLASPASPRQGEHGFNVEALDALLERLRRRASYVVLDLPHQWSPWMHDLLLDTTELVLVACPDLANLRDSRNILEELGEARGIDRPTRLIINRDGASPKGELAPKDFEDSIKRPPDLVIPFDAATFGMAMNNGEPISRTAPNAAAARAFETLAWMVSGRERPKGKRDSVTAGGWAGLLAKLNPLQRKGG